MGSTRTQRALVAPGPEHRRSDSRIGGGKLKGVTKRSAATEQEIETSPAEESDNSTIARVSAARRSGDKAERGVRSLLRRASEKNKAALDRLAK